MAANEIAERFAAAAWVKCGGAGGEGQNVFDVSTLSFRSFVGFKNILITTVDVNASPMVVLQLDRVFSRRETAVLVTRHGTVGSVEGDRLSYPLFGGVPTEVAQLAAHPCLMAWFGDDLRNPTWMPFGLGGSPLVPVGEPIDLFDAIAVELPVGGANALAGDFSVAVFEHNRPDAEDEPIVDELPAELPPDPIPDLNPKAWFRSDTFTAGEPSALVGRMGTEGNLEGSFPTPVADPTFNNQLSITWDGQPDGLTSTMPASFWNFLGTEDWTAYVIWTPRDENGQNVFTNEADEFNFLGSVTDDSFIASFGVGGADALFNTAGFAAALDVANQLACWVDSADAQPITVQTTSGGQNGGSFDVPPAGSVTETLRALTAGGQGEVSICEWLFFDRALTGPEKDTVQAYFNERYGSI